MQIMPKSARLFFVGQFASGLLLYSANQLGSVNGLVVDAMGQPLQWAIVELECRGCKAEIPKVLTGQDGYYVLPNIPPGAYSLRFSMPKLGEKRLPSVIVKPGKSTVVRKFTFGASCVAAGANCDVFPYQIFRLPCTAGLDLIQDETAKSKTFSSEEMESLALFKPMPELPVQSEPIAVYVVVGADGRVLCADTNAPNGRARDEVIATASTWRFRPVVEHGIPKAIIGSVYLGQGHR